MIILNRQSDALKSNDDEFPDPLYINGLRQLEESGKDVYVLQVGAFDGKYRDDLFPFLFRNKEWGATLIEPMELPFKALMENYEHRENIDFIMKAVDTFDGYTQVWHIPYDHEVEELPSWASGCTTTRKYRNPMFGVNCTKEQFELIKKNTTIGSIECTILARVLDDIDKDINVLHIDVEGADWDVLRQFNFDMFFPDIIHFESFGLTDDELGEANYLLEEFGYSLFQYRNNITAVNAQVIDIDRLKNLKEEETLESDVVG